MVVNAAFTHQQNGRLIKTRPIHQIRHQVTLALPQTQNVHKGNCFELIQDTRGAMTEQLKTLSKENFPMAMCLLSQ